MKMAKAILLLILVFVLFSCNSTDPNVSSSTAVPLDNEIVMTDGMKITATTGIGAMAITATKGLERTYTWEGETRSVIMWPRKARWFGSMGIYYPGPGHHWKEHNGINRGVVEEGHRHFNSEESALKWLKWNPSCVYRDDGLVVCYSKWRNKLNVDVWQIYIGGKVPSKFQESATDVINTMEKWPDDVKVTYKSICYVDGHKPTKLLGNQNEMIKVQYISEKASNNGMQPDAAEPRR